MVTTNNSQTELEISKSVGQLCEQLSLTNITVPKIDHTKDVFEFIIEFEVATESLPDTQRNKLLAKAFSPGRYRTWYELELKPLLSKTTTTWDQIKNTIIERYSKTEDRDRHFKRLRSIKFDPNGSLELYDYVEDLLYSLSKAWPNEKDEAAKIRYIKSCLPSSILPTLSSIPEYNSSTTLNDFKKALKRYDVIKEQYNDSPEGSSNKLNTPEIVNLLKDIAKCIKDQNETITRSVVSALQPIHNNSQVQPERCSSTERPSRSRERGISPFTNNHQRSPSPLRQRASSNTHYQSNYPNQNYPNQNYRNQNYQNNNYPPANNFPNGRGYRAPTPPSRANYNNRNYMQGNPPINNERSNSNQYQLRPIEVFSSQDYFQRFGQPPTPCDCGFMHWSRHCSFYGSLNE